MDNKVKEKKKLTISRKQIIIISLIIAIIASIVILIIKSNKKQISIISPELARAMSYAQFEDGDENIEGTENVKFSSFFLRDINGDGYAEKIKGTCKAIGKEDTLYMELNVQTAGYLKNGKIEINGNNFYLQTALQKTQS